MELRKKLRTYWVLGAGLLAITALLIAFPTVSVGNVSDANDDLAQAAQATETPTAEDAEQPESSPTEPGETATPEPEQTMPTDFGFGVEAPQERIDELNIDIPPSGEGLPPGGGTPDEGEEVYLAQCLGCHGREGAGSGIGPQLIAQGDVWQIGEPRTVDNYWPYATTIYDYVNRAMPFDNPNSLEPDQVYAVTAYLLYLGGIIDQDQEMNAETLPAVEMPNVDTFEPCWPEQCLPEPEFRDTE